MKTDNTVNENIFRANSSLPKKLISVARHFAHLGSRCHFHSSFNMTRFCPTLSKNKKKKNVITLLANHYYKLPWSNDFSDWLSFYKLIKYKIVLNYLQTHIDTHTYIYNIGLTYVGGNVLFYVSPAADRFFFFFFFIEL